MKTPLPEPDLFFTENFGLGDVSNVYGHSESQLRAAMVAAYNEAIEDAAKDAKRYRWLRDNCLPHEVDSGDTSFGKVMHGIAFVWPTNWFKSGVKHTCNATLDAGIDAKLKETP